MANPKNGNFVREAMEWRAKAIHLAEEERKRVIFEMQQRSEYEQWRKAERAQELWWKALSPTIPQFPIAPKPPLRDPHAALVGQIEKLKAVEPVKVSKRMPDYCHTLTAWRGWSVKNEQLAGLGNDKRWMPKQAHPATCTSGGKSHRVPSKDCQCGYWSFKSMDILTQALRPYGNSVVAVGSVEIWGRVIECENGYRSEFAYPKELWLLKPDMDYLSVSYGVPIRRLGE